MGPVCPDTRVVSIVSADSLAHVDKLVDQSKSQGPWPYFRGARIDGSPSFTQGRGGALVLVAEVAAVKPELGQGGTGSVFCVRVVGVVEW